jgi:hypothetical protein
MYAFIDESGNTGANVFDLQQPDFLTAAFITRADFDSLYGQQVASLASQAGLDEIHGNELGPKGIDTIGRDLADLLDSIPHALFIGRVVKRDLSVLKFFDTVFDPNDNPTVPRHAYYSPLRVLLVNNFRLTLDEKDLVQFWQAVSSKSESNSRELLSRACSGALRRVERISDNRARDLVEGALRWARENPGELTLFAREKEIRARHYPNLVIFPELLWTLQRQADEWGTSVTEIRHDEQSQFGAALRSVHEAISAAKHDVVIRVGPLEQRLGAVPDSRFVLPSSSSSPGIQVADVLLWLLKQTMSGREFGAAADGLLKGIGRASRYELSMGALQYRLIEELEKIERPLTAEDLRRGQAILDVEEDRRRKALDVLDDG